MLADLLSVIKTKYIVWTGLAVVMMIVLLAAFSGGFVLIKSDHEAVTGFSQRIDVSDADKAPLTINKGSWKLVFLGLGDYHIEFSSGNKKTLYQPTIGIFSFQTTSINLKKQQQSKSYGFQNADCLVKNQQSELLIFYGCNKSIDNQRTITTTSNGYDFNDYPSSFSVAPYLGGLLQVDDFSDIEAEFGVISASQYGDSGSVTTDANKKFEASFDNPRLITDQQDVKNSRFVYYNRQQKKMYLFSNLQATPAEVDLSKLTKQKEGFLFNFYLEGNSLYVSSSLDTERGLGFGDEEAVKPEATKGQEFLVFDFDSPGSPVHLPLSSGLILEHFVSYKGGLIFSGYTVDKAKPGLYIIEKNKKEARLLFNNQTLDLCVNKDKLYYLSGDYAVYEYLPQKSTSYLVYESQNHNPVNLNCANGIISFPAQTKEGGESDYSWASLGQGSLDANKTRVEDLFPILEDSSYRISYAYIFGDKVYIILNGNGVCGVVDDETKTVTTNHLKDLGLDISSFTLDIRYDC